MEFFSIGGNAAAFPFEPAIVQLQWSSNYGPTSEFSDTGNAFAPAHLIVTPPPQSLASFWSLTGSNESEILATYSCSIFTTVDVYVDMVLEDGESVATVTTTASGVAGQLYAGYLDRSVGAGALFIPISYQSLN